MGNKKAKVIDVFENDVDQLNLLQLNNYQNCTYFNNGISQEYQKKLLRKCNVREKIKTPDVHEAPVMNMDGSLLVVKSLDIKTNLNLSYIKLIKKVKLKEFNPGKLYMRNRANTN